MLMIKYDNFEYFNKYLSKIISTDSTVFIFFDDNMKVFSQLNDFIISKIFYENSWRSQNTIKTNSQHLLEFFIYIESNNLNWKEITHQHLNQWRDNIKDCGLSGKKLSNNTVNQKIDVISSFYLWAKIENIISFSPFQIMSRQLNIKSSFNQKNTIVNKNILVCKLPRDKPIVKIPTLEELKLFFLQKMPIETKIMALLLYDTGLRREEIYSLDLNAFTNANIFENFVEIYLDNENMKTKLKKNRKIIMSFNLYELVKDFLGSKTYKENSAKFILKNNITPSRLFITRQGNYYSGDTLNKSFKYICKKVFNDEFKITPHILRHSFATHNLVYNLDKFNGSEERMLSWISNRLGHASVSITREHYIHFINDLKIKENEVLTKFEENINSIYKGR